MRVLRFLFVGITELRARQTRMSAATQVYAKLRKADLDIFAVGGGHFE
jgi:arginine decarboxylase-like protein